MAAYNASSASTQLKCAAIELNDSLQGDGDNRIDAGETMQFYPTLRTTGGAADSITCWLSCQEAEDSTLLTMLTPRANFGHSLAANSRSRSANPIVFTVDSNVGIRDIPMVLYATSPNAEDTLRFPYTLQIENTVALRGLISQDTTLYADKTYIVTDNLGVAEGATLTIKPGTSLKFKSGKVLSIAGRIVAIGTPDSMITFTKADEQRWNGMTSTNNGYQNTMSYCIIEGIEEQQPFRAQRHTADCGPTPEGKHHARLLRGVAIGHRAEQQPQHQHAVGRQSYSLFHYRTPTLFRHHSHECQHHHGQRVGRRQP